MITKKDKKFLFKKIIEFLNNIENIRLRGLYLHLIIEGYLNEIIKTKFKNPKMITDSIQYSFYKKAEILRSFGSIDANTFHNLKKINRVRNHLAHDFFVADSIIEEELEKMNFPKGMEIPPECNQDNRVEILMDMAFEVIHKKLDPLI